MLGLAIRFIFFYYGFKILRADDESNWLKATVFLMIITVLLMSI